ncbi:hypothetical protein JTB14_001234 [Gonioctena quinquepunctata]|nr:hypothetical protein JTB14_001234 [Gonioctena quinquepunctata]
MKCMVVFCENKGKIPGLTYFMLTSRRHDSWMSALGKDPTKEHSSDRNCVCAVHFRVKDKFVVNNKLRLRPDAMSQTEKIRGELKRKTLTKLILFSHQ